jgi:fumarate hydratase subunit beta
MEKKMKVPFLPEEAVSLIAGDFVYLTGTIYTARDAAHKRMAEALESGRMLPFDLKGNVIYYMGPSPAGEGKVIGSAGPTTSGRMDKYTPALLDLGLAGMIGKGKRSIQVKQSIVHNKAVYFATIGGAGALLSRSIVASESVAYEDLGTESIRRLTVRDFPVIVVIDSQGNDLYEINQQQYKRVLTV